MATAIRRINLQQQEIGADISVKTKDNAFLTLPVKVQYRASDDPVGAVKGANATPRPHVVDSPTAQAA